MSNDKRPSASRELLEFSFTLLAAISGSLAALGAFWGASQEQQRTDLERKPAIHLSCQPEFRALDIAQGIKPPSITALLTSRGARWIHAFLDDRDDTTTPFARCTLRNYGRLPAFNMRLAVNLEFSGGDAKGSAIDSFLDVPGLSPDSSYSFSLMNGARKTLRFSFSPVMTLTRVDTGKEASTTLFRDQELLELQQRGVASAEPSAPPVFAASGSVVHIRNFMFVPHILRVRPGSTVTFVNNDAEAHTVTGDRGDFDSGAMDPNAIWRRTFSNAGVYRYTCTFHPHMRGTVIVSPK